MKAGFQALWRSKALRIVELAQQALVNRQYRWPYPKLVLFICGFLVAIALVTHYLMLSGYNISFNENGTIEEFERITLLTCAIISAYIGFKRRAVFGVLFAQFVLGSIAIAIFFRETPFCDNQFGLLWSCAGRIVQPGGSAIALLFCLFFVAIQLYRKPIPTLLMAHPRMSWPIAAAFAFAFAGQIFEQFQWIALEEMFELGAFLLLLLISILNGFFLHDNQLPR